MSLPIAQILSGTPLWVYGLFAFLTQRGLRRLQPGVSSLGKVLLMPGVFIVWGLIGLFQRGIAEAITPWLAGLVAGVALSAFERLTLQVDPQRRLVYQAGSVLPLVRILAIFVGHYVLNVAAAMHPAEHAMYMSWDAVVSGASAGYFAGWALKFWRAYRTAPRVELSA